MSHLEVVKWVFLLLFLIILTLMKLVFINMILKILFMLDFWLGIIDINNAKHLTKK